MTAYKIFLAYFPDLGASHNFKDVGRFVRDQDIRPGAAAVMCAWLSYKEREFKFMRPALLGQLWEEYGLTDEDDRASARDFCRDFGGRMDDAMKVYDEWAATAKTNGK